MSDFLSRLAERQLGQIVTVEPRVPDLYARVSAAIPLPLVEEVPGEIFESRRISRAPAPSVNPNSEQSDTAGFSNMTEGAPAELAQPIERPVTESREAYFSPAGIEKASAAVAPEDPPRLEPNVAVVSKSQVPLTPQIDPEPQESLRPGSTASASRLFFTGEEAQPRPVTHQLLTVLAAPARLELKLPDRGEVAAREPADSEPPVQVTIGRIEVTALSAPAPPRRAPAARKQGMSLDDYLARRRGER
jgi:hypothetical protein